MPAFRPASIRVHPDADDAYRAVERAAAKGRQPERAIWKSFETALARIRRDGQWGEVIPRSKIPKHFAKGYEVTNLYCVDLAHFRRCFYTIVGRDVVFLDLVDHPTYDRWFGGKGK